MTRIMLRVGSVVAGVMMVLVAMLILPGTASAHTGLQSSTPSEGQTVAGPLSNVLFVFSGTPTAIDDGIAVADAAGAQFFPATVVQNGLEIVASFDPPLQAGVYALAWRVQSDDTHFIDGNFRFTVEAPAPTSVAALPAATPAPTTAVASEAAVDAAPSDTTTTVVEILAADVATTASDALPIAPALGGESSDDEGASVARIGRLILFPSAIAAIGLLAFATFALAGRRAELGTLIRAVRWLGIGVVLGGSIQVVGLSSLLGGFGEVLGNGVGRAAVGRVIAGVLLVVGFGSIRGTTRPRLADRPTGARSLSASVAQQPVQSETRPAAAPADPRWRPGVADIGGLAGIAIIIVSFAFDGHTVSRGPRLLHALATIMHVGGAGIWAGGLVALAVVMWRRFRDGVATRAVEMVVRFSVIAMVSLGLTGFTGLVMALFIDNDVIGYFSTEWGRFLLVKLVFVAAAGAIGAYNHFMILPALSAPSADEAVTRKARATVTAEATLVMCAALVTALLVASSTFA